MSHKRSNSKRSSNRRDRQSNNGRSAYESGRNQSNDNQRSDNSIETLDLGVDFIEFLKDELEKARKYGWNKHSFSVTKRQAKKIFQIILENRARLGIDTNRMELSVIERKYSDFELRLAHLDKDFEFSRITPNS